MIIIVLHAGSPLEEVRFVSGKAYLSVYMVVLNGISAFNPSSNAQSQIQCKRRATDLRSRGKEVTLGCGLHLDEFWKPTFYFLSEELSVQDSFTERFTFYRTSHNSNLILQQIHMSNFLARVMLIAESLRHRDNENVSCEDYSYAANSYKVLNTVRVKMAHAQPGPVGTEQIGRCLLFILGSSLPLFVSGTNPFPQRGPALASSAPPVVHVLHIYYCCDVGPFI